MMSDPDETTQELVRLVRQLIDIESVSSNELAITDFIRSHLPHDARVVYDEDTVLAAFIGPVGVRKIVLAGHTDTVPIGNAAFPSRIEGDSIVGRGATDMKSSLAVMLQLAQAWDSRSPVQDAEPLALGLLFFGREELPPSHNPLPKALGAIGLSADDLVVLMEPTGNAVELGCMGNLNLTLNYTGRAAHSARPWTGENAAHKAIEALEGLAWAEQRTVDVGGYSFTEVASVTGLRSGLARNVIPPSAQVDINIRFAHSQVTSKEREATWLARFPGAEIEVAGHAMAAPPIVDSKLVDQLISAGAIEARPKQAWTNAADFAELGIPVLHFGPGEPALAHTDTEAVSIASLHRCFETLTQFLAMRRGSRPVKDKEHQ